MAMELDKIINNIDTKEENAESVDKVQQNESEKNFDASLNVNPLENKFLNNLDDIEDNVGVFNIKIFGIGGAGCNVIKYMKEQRQWANNVEMFALNTDAASLKKICNLSNVYLLGKKILRGSGSGGDPTMGKIAAEGDVEEIKQVLRGTDILFLVAGLGKGTGSGATPIIAKAAKELGILTIGIVNLPSVKAEGRTVYSNALLNLRELKKHVNCITTISNDLIIKNNANDISFMKAFEKANDQVTTIVGEIADIINKPTEMNVDFADLRSFFTQSTSFNANAFDFNDEYSLNGLKKKIKECLDKSYTDIKLTNANKVIVNIQINESTPTSLISDVRNIFKDLAQNNDLCVVPGVDYTQTKNIHMSFLVATKEEDNETAINKMNDDIISFSKPENNQQQIEFDSPKNAETNVAGIDSKLEEYRHATNRAFINKEKFEFDNEDSLQDNTPNNQLSSKECADIITKAVNSVIKTTKLDGNIAQKSKNN